MSAITSLSLATALSFWYLGFCVSPRYSPWKGCGRLGTGDVSRGHPVHPQPQHCPMRPPAPAPFWVEALLVLEELAGTELGLQQSPALRRQLLPVLLALQGRGRVGVTSMEGHRGTWGPGQSSPRSHLPAVEDAPQLLVGIGQELVRRGGPGPVQHRQRRQVPPQPHQELLHLGGDNAAGGSGGSSVQPQGWEGAVSPLSPLTSRR